MDIYLEFIYSIFPFSFTSEHMKIWLKYTKFLKNKHLIKAKITNFDISNYFHSCI